MKRTTRRCNCALFRAGVRSVYFVIILLLYSLWQHYSSSQNNNNHRQLIEEEDDDDLCPDINKADPAWLSIFYLLGVFYTFIAIAIVCDELFVPTLEEIASDRHLNLSMDVAGATLMAAGGSAPELFTSIFGTFVQHSEVGIGTVVGSAVFNVLFVIAMCALWSKEVLELTWWPLFRDSTYYSIGLIVLGKWLGARFLQLFAMTYSNPTSLTSPLILGLFVGVISPSEIELWEAIVLFLMYIGYVFVMCFNRRLYKLITGRELPATGEGTDKNLHGGLGDEEKQEGKEETEEAQDEEAPQQPQRPHPVKVMSNRSLISALTITTPQGGVQWPGTFRSGILNILRSSKSLTEAAGIGIVAIIAGDVHHVFRKVDVDDNGEIDREELAQLFAKLGHTVANDELDDLMQELDHNKDGKITEEDFTVWYIQSEQQISSRVRVIFDYFDTDNSGTINHSKIKSLLENVEPAVTDQDVEEAMLAMYQNGSRDEISFEEFSNWYIHSMIYNRQTQRAKAELQGILENLKPPSPGSVMTYIKCITIFPIVLVLGYTVPDVRRPGCHKFCYISFVLSIAWIGFFSYFMVGTLYNACNAISVYNNSYS